LNEARRWAGELALPHIPAEIWKLMAHCAALYGLPPSALKYRNQRPQAVAARRMAARAMRQQGLSYQTIGKYLGGYDHTTIMNLCKNDGVPVRGFSFDLVDWSKL
jgi:chromosomal replication initiation ATPase DnaA